MGACESKMRREWTGRSLAILIIVLTSSKGVRFILERGSVLKAVPNLPTKAVSELARPLYELHKCIKAVPDLPGEGCQRTRQMRKHPGEVS